MLIETVVCQFECDLYNESYRSMIDQSRMET